MHTSPRQMTPTGDACQRGRALAFHPTPQRCRSVLHFCQRCLTGRRAAAWPTIFADSEVPLCVSFFTPVICRYGSATGASKPLECRSPNELLDIYVWYHCGHIGKHQQTYYMLPVKQESRRKSPLPTVFWSWFVWFGCVPFEDALLGPKGKPKRKTAVFGCSLVPSSQLQEAKEPDWGLTNIPGPRMTMGNFPASW